MTVNANITFERVIPRLRGHDNQGQWMTFRVCEAAESLSPSRDAILPKRTASPAGYWLLATGYWLLAFQRTVFTHTE
jgi:hypothetical protein